MPRSRSILLGTSLGALLALPSTGRAAEPRLPDQIMVLRSPSSTRLSVRHVPGDAAAEVRIRRPPPGALETLAEQRGPFVRAVEHVLLERGTLTLLLRLTTDAVRIEARRLRKPSGWSIVLTPSPTPPFPSLGELVGHLPGLVPPPPRPVLLPAEPRDSPCTGNPDARAILGTRDARHVTEVALERRLDVLVEPVCRSWVMSRLAAEALERGHDVRVFERWAYLFNREDEGWELHPEAFAQASLVAVEVLARRGYFPEAEAVVAEETRYAPHHAPFRAMALANLFAIRGEHDEAETLYRQIVDEGFDPWMIYQASLGRALNALAGADTLGTLAHVERARRLLRRPESLPGDLWVVGGEAALALGELSLAKTAFEIAARSRGEDARALALLRLADLEARAGRAKSALEGWTLAQAVGMRCMGDHVHLRRVLAHEEDRREVLTFLKGQAQHSRCAPVRMEAQFALARIHVLRGEETLALRPALEVVREGTSRWGPARPHRKMVAEVARSAIARFERHHDPAGLVSFFEAHLEAFAHILDPRSRLEVGRAYDAVGASMRGAEELLSLLTEAPELPFRETLVLDLGDALLRAGDTYRTGLVLRHLEARHTPGELPWRREGLAGRLELARNHPREAISHLRAAIRAAPAGDPRRRLHLPLAQAQLALGRILAAARALDTAADDAGRPRGELEPLAIQVLSECARRCSKSDLRQATRRLVRDLGPGFVTPRLAHRLALRGAWRGASEEDSPLENPKLWSRLDALGIRPTGRAPASGEEKR